MFRFLAAFGFDTFFLGSFACLDDPTSGALGGAECGASAACAGAGAGVVAGAVVAVVAVVTGTGAETSCESRAVEVGCAGASATSLLLVAERRTTEPIGMDGRELMASLFLLGERKRE